MNTAAEIVEKVRQAGIVGAGGAGFPTHVKLSAKVDTVLANGASCEPLLAGDPWLMEHEAAAIVRGLLAVMAAVSAGSGKVCLKGKHKAAMAAVREAVAQAGHSGLEVVELGDFYPAGDEQVLVYEVLGRVVPEGGIPLQVGAVVSNVESLYNVARALQDGLPVTDRVLTVAGEVTRPMVTRVPLGVRIGDVIGMAGGASIPEFKVVVGGPMMGVVTDNLDLPVTKTTSGLIVLPPNHNVTAGKTRDPARLRYVTRVACCQCSRCTDMCPRHLLGHALRPHMIMRRLGSPLGLDQEIMQDALICSECGICEKFACPMMISPREVNAQVKRELLAAGIKRAPRTEGYRPSSFRGVRRLPTSRLIERLQLKPYDVHPGFYEFDLNPDRLVIPLKQHLGAPAKPAVKVGDLVKRGDPVGEIPEGALGARVHAGLDGRVAAVSDAVTLKR